MSKHKDEKGSVPMRSIQCGDTTFVTGFERYAECSFDAPVVGLAFHDNKVFAKLADGSEKEVPQP